MDSQKPGEILFQVSVRHFLSFSHIQSAALMSRHAFSIEQQFQKTKKVDMEVGGTLSQYAMNSIWNSASFLEATVNELFKDAADELKMNHYFRFKSVPLPIVTGLAKYVTHNNVWGKYKSKRHENYKKLGAYGNEILTKYQFACNCVGVSDLNEGDARFHNAKLLIEVRNKLTHFEPETVPIHDADGLRPMQEISGALRNKFLPNQIFKTGNHKTFPDYFLGHGAAEWGVETAFNFADYFFDHAHIERPYEYFRPKCQTR